MQSPTSDELPEEELINELRVTIAGLLTGAERAVADASGQLSSGIESELCGPAH
jgi:hypothetical protein